MARKRYLKKTPLAEARAMLLAVVDPTALAIEEIAVDDALDRITAEPIFARISSPHYHASAMDGICVRAEDTFGATEFAGKKLALAKSETPGAGAFKYVDTGNSLPPWANAVVMIEKVHQLDAATVEIFESVAPWNHVRLVGEDVVATELLLPRSHRLPMGQQADTQAGLDRHSLSLVQLARLPAFRQRRCRETAPPWTRERRSSIHREPC